MAVCSVWNGQISFPATLSRRSEATRGFSRSRSVLAVAWGQAQNTAPRRRPVQVSMGSTLTSSWITKFLTLFLREPWDQTHLSAAYFQWKCTEAELQKSVSPSKYQPIYGEEHAVIITHAFIPPPKTETRTFIETNLWHYSERKRSVLFPQKKGVFVLLKYEVWLYTTTATLQQSETSHHQSDWFSWH